MVEWADIVNAHIVPGEGIIAGLKEVGLPKGRGLLLLAEMSSGTTLSFIAEGSLATDGYTQTAVKMAESNKDFVFGFISKRRITDDPDMIHMTPGVQFKNKDDNLGQRYRTPEEVIAGGSDIIIVGRGIYQNKDNIVSEAQSYQKAGWAAYQHRIAQQ